MAGSRVVSAALLLGVVCVCRTGWPATGDLDPSFGAGGVVTTPVGGAGSIFALALQPDGRIVAAGQGALAHFFTIVRYLSDGTLDSGFGTGGIVQTLPEGRANGIAFGVAVQPDGKIVVAGQVNDPSGSVLGLMRLLPDGGPDASFGTAGSVVDGALSGGRAVVVQGDGRIVVALAQASLARYLSDGSRDPSFGTGGIATAPVGATAGTGALLLQPDGKPVAVWAMSSGGMDLVRWDAIGSLDTTFGTGGVVTASGAPFYGPALARQPDGKLLLGSGDITFLSTLRRWDAAGNRDLTFTGSPFGTGRMPLLTALAVQPGRILAAGIDVHPPLTSPATDFLLAGIRPDGRPSPDLGILAYDLELEDTARVALLQPDARLLIGGASAATAIPGMFGTGDFALARIDVSGCGDGIVGAGEACDDGNFESGDGCDINCTPTACGNGILTAGEACDDGNTVAGDCCSETCQDEPSSQSCADDGEECTEDHCDGSGSCGHFPLFGAPCDDGDSCTAGDTCVFSQGFICWGTPVSPCGPATTTTTTTTPEGTTSTTVPELWTGEKLVIHESPNPEKKRLTVVSKDASIGIGRGNGTSDDPRINGASLRITLAGGPPRIYTLSVADWKVIGDEGANRGYKYVDKLRLEGPVRSLVIKTGRVFKATAKGLGLGYTLTSDPTPVSVTLTLGTARSCMEFGGETEFVAEKPSYVAKHAPAPASCGP